MASHQQEQRQQQQQHQRRGNSAVFFAFQFLSVLVIASSLLFCHSFQQLQPSLGPSRRYTKRTSSSTSSISISRSPSPPSHSPSQSSSSQFRRKSNLHFYTDPDAPSSPASTPSFQQRMMEQLRQRQSNLRKKKIDDKKTKTKSTALIEEVKNLKDYKQVLDEASHDDRMVAVFWYSPWCKACKAASPGVKTIAKHHPDVKFIQVPVIEDNVLLHQGLNVPSVPYMHLYQPELDNDHQQSLVEERRMTRKKLSGFQKLLDDYEKGSCDLSRGESWSTSCPYANLSGRNDTTTKRNKEEDVVGYAAAATVAV